MFAKLLGVLFANTGVNAKQSLPSTIPDIHRGFANDFNLSIVSLSADKSKRRPSWRTYSFDTLEQNPCLGVAR